MSFLRWCLISCCFLLLTAIAGKGRSASDTDADQTLRRRTTPQPKNEESLLIGNWIRELHLRQTKSEQPKQIVVDPYDSIIEKSQQPLLAEADLPIHPTQVVANNLTSSRRSLQQSRCERRYYSLKRRLQQAYDGQTITLNCGTFCASTKPIIITANFVTLRCNPNCANIDYYDESSRGCIIDKRGKARRLLTVWGSNFVARGIEFSNALMPHGNGGAVMVAGPGENLFIDCTFRNNTALNGDGGALFGGDMGLTGMVDSIFIRNKALIGGAARINNGFSSRNPNVRGSNNIAGTRCANGVWYESENYCQPLRTTMFDRTSTLPTSRCIASFEELRARLANLASTTDKNICIFPGVIVVNEELSVTLDGTNIFCSADGIGATPSCVLDRRNGPGRIFNIQGNDVTISGISMNNCVNWGQDGGAMYISGDRTKILNCGFQNNKATNGGAFYADLGLLVIVEGTTFQGNAAIRGGVGRVSNLQTDARNPNSAFGNKAQFCADEMFDERHGLCLRT